MAEKRRKAQGKTPQKTNYATPALEKGLDILELLAHQTEGLTKSQLARELDRTVSEIFRMLLCLERRGYIAQVAEDRYSLTMRLFQLVQEHPPTERLIADALPVMKRLAHEAQQSCHLGVLEADKVVILAQVNSPTNLGFYVKLGSTVDLMEAASGYVILAHQGKDERERTIAEWRRRTNKRLPGDLSAHLDRIRKSGFEKRASYLVKGVVNISFPICDERGSALGALTIPYIQYATESVPQRQVIEALRRAAEEINLAIGGKAKLM
ncbi:MAG TPA: IclR family transcriptional regulator [Acidobacteriaceae bacterium]|jgi:DNA-binding IclR family transcriptional regulator|nr:IclR family transcriptional regulator [Acidobacteriaceae bacterium]